MKTREKNKCFCSAVCTNSFILKAMLTFIYINQHKTNLFSILPKYMSCMLYINHFHTTKIELMKTMVV